MSVTHVIPAARLLIGLGLIGKALLHGERPLPQVRTLLEKNGFSNNEIATIFDAIRNDRVKGVSVTVRRQRDMVYWTLVTTWSS